MRSTAHDPWRDHRAGPGAWPESLSRAQAAVAAGVRQDRAAPHVPHDPTAEQHYAGAVLVVMSGDEIISETAHGWAQTHDGDRPLAAPRAMTANMRFDLASITKVLATTAVAITLVDDGLLDLDAPVAEGVAELRGPEHRRITARHLLRHRSGLPQWAPLYLHAPNDSQAAVGHIAGQELLDPPGATRRYSDLGMILLGELCARIGQAPLDQLAAQRVHRPLGLDSVGFAPGPADDIVATSAGNRHEQQMIANGEPYPVEGDPGQFSGWRSHTLVGEVHDGNCAYAMNGVAGHAGLFGTAQDVAAFGRVVADGMAGLDTPLARATTVRQFTDPAPAPGEALGFWTDRLDVAGIRGALGHRGFTGCEFAFHPGTDLVVVLLSNRVHPSDAFLRPLQPVWENVVGALAHGIGYQL